MERSLQIYIKKQKRTRFQNNPSHREKAGAVKNEWKWNSSESAQSALLTALGLGISNIATISKAFSRKVKQTAGEKAVKGFLTEI